MHKVPFRNIITETSALNWNVLDEYKNHTLVELKKIVEGDRLPYAVCVMNLTGDLNVGLIMRTASLMGAERMIIFGRRRYDKRSTVGAQNYITVNKVAGLNDDLSYDVEAFDAAMERWNYHPIFIETGGVNIRIVDWKAISPTPCLVFGNEGRGIPETVIRDGLKVSIPQRGVLRSLNVAVTAGIACWEISQGLS